VGPEEAVSQQELPGMAFRSSQGAHVTFAMQFIQAQALEHADGCVHRGVHRAEVSPAVPAAIRQLLFQQMLREDRIP
jgi:hypothetical protein